MSNTAKRLEHYELELAKKVDNLVPISETDAAYFRGKGIHTPGLTIPTGLNTQDYPFTEQPDQDSVFFIGALDWLPNQEGLLWFLQNVFDRLLTAKPALKFHVAGRNAPGHFERKLKHPGIIYHGEVENAMDFIRSHRIMVAPLLTGSGIRIKILEGMALGRPVVTTTAGIEGIPAKNHRQVVVEDDPAMFSSQLIKLLQDTEKSEAQVMEARKLTERYFDTFELSKRLSQFYKNEE